jgi:ubiquinone/menaquinone biosynthesis C-methylase UbiE
VVAHYSSPGLYERIIAGLRAAGKNADAPQPEDLYPVDQFHGCNVDSTRSLMKSAAIPQGGKVLDVGGGLGGPARLIAKEAQCQVTVLDLTPDYATVGEKLTAISGMADHVKFKVGSALEIPFPDGTFDAVWTQHSTMNIADKRRLYSEIHRVLRPGGVYAFHDIFEGNGEPVYHPITWATDPSSTFLITPAAVRALLTELGFHERSFSDETANHLAWMAARAPATPPPAPPPLGLHLLNPEIGKTLGPNYARSLKEGRTAVVQAVFTRS